MYKFKVGDTVFCSGTGIYGKGTSVTITELYSQNGWNYYKDSTNVVHREKDLEKFQGKQS